MAKLEKIIIKWEELLNVFDENSKNSFMSGVYDLNKTIQKALTIPDGGDMAILIIENSIKDYISSKNISLSLLVEEDGDDSLWEFITKYKELLKYVKDSGVHKVVQQEINIFKKALDNLSLLDSSTEELVQNTYMYAEIRLSALNALETLNTHQFKKGISSFDSVNLSTKVHYFKNLHLSLESLASDSTPSGIYLSAIGNEEDELFTFFVISIKRGDNIYLLTDIENRPTSSPNYTRKGRGAGRERKMSSRINNNLFPYELILSLATKEQLNYVIEYSDDKTVATRDAIFSFDKMMEDSKIWMTMLFYLLKEKYFGEGVVILDEVSTTPYNYRDTDVDKDSTLALTGFEAYDLPYKDHTLASINRETLDILGMNKPTGKNDWMEEFYKEPVKEFIEENSQALVSTTNVTPIMQDRTRDELDRGHWGFAEDRAIVPESSFVPPNMFGTKEQVESNLTWFARQRQADIIYEMAKRDYEDNKKETFEWYKEGISNRIHTLAEDVIVRNEYFVEVSKRDSVLSTDRGYQAVCHTTWEVLSEVGSRWWTKHNYFTGWNKQQFPTCFYNGKVGSLFLYFHVQDGKSIARVLGCGFDELPEQLKHIQYRNQSSGNSILNNIDPLETIKNPWEDMKFSFGIVFSKSGYKQLCKELDVSTELPIEF